MDDEANRWTLVALRHLPPGSPIPTPSTEPGRLLFAELLELPDDLDALHWLADERADVIARMTLLQALLALRRLIIHVRDASAGKEVAPASALARHGIEPADLSRAGHAWARQYEGVLGGLLNLPDDAEPLASIERADAADAPPQMLEAALRELIARRGQAESAAPSRTLKEWQPFFDDLLRVPHGASPLRWLARERSRECAHTALDSVLAPARSRKLFDLGRQLRVWEPKQAGSHAPIQFESARIVEGESAWSLTARARLATTGLVVPPDSVLRLVEWTGFDSVADDHGYCYLAKRSQFDLLIRNPGPPGGEWTATVRMNFHPALAPAATSLAFFARPVRFLATVSDRPHRSGPVISLPAQSLGELVWRVQRPV